MHVRVEVNDTLPALALLLSSPQAARLDPNFARGKHSRPYQNDRLGLPSAITAAYVRSYQKLLGQEPLNGANSLLNPTPAD